MVQYQMLAPVNKEHVLGVVIETGLHHAVAKHNAHHKHQYPAASGPVVSRHPDQAVPVERQNEHETQYGERREVIGYKVV